jgi:GNAT superfamily N-acetyltransferase
MALHFRDRLNYTTPEAWVPDLFVLESARDAGIERRLLDEAERRARERGCHQIVTESGYKRAEAHELFRTFRMRDAGKYFRKQLGG